MVRRVLIIIALAAFAVCALAVAQQRKAVDEARFGTVEVTRTESHVMRPSGVLVVPWHVNYQGYLTDDVGNPINDTLSMAFRIYTASSGGSEVWNETQNVIVEDAIFNVILGSVTPIPSDVFRPGESRWLELEVETQTLSPRTEITSVAYAYRALNADTADYAASVGPDNDWTITGNVLHPSGDYGLAMRSSNVLHGAYDSTHVNLGIACTTGSSAQDFLYCTVSGGENNAAKNDLAAVGGGGSNVASGWYATVGGGQNNTASGSGATVGGGGSNTVGDLYSTVGGGYENTVGGWTATVGGGGNNTTSANFATVAGGGGNSASATYSIVGGGEGNTASGNWATAGGGGNNSASNSFATVDGGYNNTASGSEATVGGGYYNTANGSDATVGGGYVNTASGGMATVGGGNSNRASGMYSTVSGGYADTVAGDYSFASGSQVRITGGTDYTFAFGRDFTTSTPNAAIFHNSVDPIRVGIGTTSPVSDLTINSGGPVIRYEKGGSGKWSTGIMTADDNFTLYAHGAAGYVMQLDHITGNVGIGLINPAFPLEMASGAHCTAGGVWTNASSREYKKDITELTTEDAMDALSELNPVTFEYKADDTDRYAGFIAEDVPDLVATKDRKGLSPMDVVAVLTEVVQNQQERIERLEAKIESMEETR